MSGKFRKAFMITAGVIGLSLSATAQAENVAIHQEANQGENVVNPTYVQEYEAVSEVLNKYIEGLKQGKSSVMKPAFSQQATMFSAGPDGRLVGGAISVLFDGIDKSSHPSPDMHAAITRIEIVGTAASARIDANNFAGITFTDFFQLLKVEGNWTVISKIFYTHKAP